MPRPIKRTDPLQLSIWLASAAILVYGIYQVVAHNWVCDDAFISFRYAKNLVNGLGLVYNAGEHVEGYSNFLWTIIIACGMWLKFDPITVSTILGGLSYFATVTALGFWSYRSFRNSESGAQLFLPLAALALLLQHDSHIWATSGLETSFVTLLITAGFVLLCEVESPKSALFAGLVLTAAAITRPEGLLFYAMGAAYLIVATRKLPKILSFYLMPILVLYLPYWLIRYSYYGWPFPNTYYAKSANLTYYSQGLEYLRLYFYSYYVLMIVPLVLAAAIVVRRKQLLVYPLADRTGRAIVLTLLFAVPYIGYIVRMGGDFMFARFFIPITPILFCALEISLRSLIEKSKLLVPVSAVILVLLVARWDPFSTNRAVGYIANEPEFYPPTFLANAQTLGGNLKRYFAGQDARIAIRGMYAMHAYYSEASVVIEEAGGLTDEFTAHQELILRGRPGHEKSSPPEYLIKRGVNFQIRGGITPSNKLDSLTCIYFGEFPAYIVTFHNQLMDHLKQYPEIGFVDIRDIIDQLIVQLRDKHDRRVLESYPFLKGYYFDFNKDPEREKWFLNPPQE